MKKCLGLALFLIFLTIPIFSQEFPEDWSYRRPIYIQENSGKNLYDYQIRLEIPYYGGAEDFSDLRFTYYDPEDGAEIEIPYYIETFERGTRAIVWVKVPYIPAGSQALIYVYYGNQTLVTSLSNPKKVFDVFDDFEDGNLTDSWDYVGSKEYWTITTDEPDNFMKNAGNDQYHRSKIFYNVTSFSNIIDVGFEVYAMVRIASGMRTQRDSLNFAVMNNTNAMVRDRVSWWYRTGELGIGLNSHQNYIRTWMKCEDESKEQFDVSYAISTRTIYNLKISFYNKELKVKIWEYGENEPEEYMVDYIFLCNPHEDLTDPDEKLYHAWGTENAIGHVFLVRQRKYVEPEPTYSIGEEEPLIPVPPITIRDILLLLAPVIVVAIIASKVRRK